MNALPSQPPVGFMECGPFPGPGMQLTFRASAAGPALAVVTAHQELSPVVSLVIGGRQMPPSTARKRCSAGDGDRRVPLDRLPRSWPDRTRADRDDPVTTSLEADRAAGDLPETAAGRCLIARPRARR